MLHRVKELALRHPLLIVAAKLALKPFPGVWVRVRDKVLTQRKSEADLERDFILIPFATFDLLYAKAPLEDRRGIGRVARELLSQLKLSSAELNADCLLAENRKQIPFYSSIHFCPDQLLPNSIVMIHDVTPLMVPECFPPPALSEWYERFAPIAHQAACIVSGSHSAAADIASKLGLEQDSIQVIYNGVVAFREDPEFSMALPAEKFVLFLGANEQYKNLDVLVRALRMHGQHDVHLVLVGDRHNAESYVAEPEVRAKIHCVGRLRDDEVSYLMRHSLALVFPSLYEGFGLPPMEAALLGVPSICSRRPAMTELLEEGVIFCDPHVPSEWRRAMDRVASDDQLVTAVRRLAVKIQRNFNWAAVADKLTKIADQLP